MLDVLITTDVEIWCDGWDNIDAKFPSAFKKYIHGSTSLGNFGLPYQMKILNESGLTGVFFVEPLFSSRFGLEPLKEIVQTIQKYNHEIQLHLHTEWVDESRRPIISDCNRKRQHLRYFDLEEQTKLIGFGSELLENAGAPKATAFRAGSFALNRDTLAACATNEIIFDSSYNASMFGKDSGIMPGIAVVEPALCMGVHEYPMTVFNDGTGSLRHVQLAACSSREIEHLLWQSLEQERKAFVILSHGFELLNAQKTGPDKLVVSRFLKLCSFLEKNSDSFRVTGFNGLQPVALKVQPSALKSSKWLTFERMLQQASGKFRR